MHRQITTLPLPSNLRAKLEYNGFSTVEDLKDMKPLELAKEAEISQEEALSVLKLLNVEAFGTVDYRKKGTVETVTLLEMLERDRKLTAINTFCEKLDDVLGGGIPLTKITEICGAPGVGKTQMCMQLCVDVQIPPVLGGIEGEALFVDTEGSFTVERLVDMAEAAVHHCQTLATGENSAESASASRQFTVKSVLSKVHVYRCSNATELIAIVNLLEEFLADHPNVKLIVIDSIAFPFRHDFDGKFHIRSRILNCMSQKLIQVATNYKLAVVLTNQMTTKVESEGQSHLIPALGESWGHSCTIRLILFWEGVQRKATLFKSPSRQEATVPYQITVGGIRDFVKIVPAKDSSDATPSSSTVAPPLKRLRSEAYSNR